jgi:ABC-type branched-subunit amino acid transport system ATPase component
MAAQGAEAILEVSGLSKHFSGIRALEDVTCAVASGGIHGLIGPNGSGKSTFFNVVSGTLPVSAGRVTLRGTDITRAGANRVARQGVARTFQGGLVVPTLSCIENVMLGFGAHLKLPLLGAMFALPMQARRAEREARDRAGVYLEMVGLADELNRWAGELIWVQRQKLQIARAMASAPVLLLLDEPTAGMGQGETEEVEALVRRINDDGVTIMLVSHDVDLVGRLSDHITVLMYGEKISEGPPKEVLADRRVQEAYLGV